MDRWIARGAAQHFVVKRLRNADTILDAPGISRLRGVTLRSAGRPYDLTFEWSDDRIYCSAAAQGDTGSFEIKYHSTGQHRALSADRGCLVLVRIQ